MTKPDRRTAYAYSRRHSAEVLADNLDDALEKWPWDFTAHDREMIGELRLRLLLIAKRRRSRPT